MTTSVLNVGLLVLAITSVASTMEIDQALLPIWTQCDIHILSHRCTNNNAFTPFSINAVDQELEDLAVRKLSSRGLPFRFTMLPCNTPFNEIYDSIFANRQTSRCQTLLWSLKLHRGGERDSLDVRITYFGFNVNSARDFGVVLFRQEDKPVQVIELNNGVPGVQMENTLFVEIKANTADVGSIAVIRRHCDNVGLTGIDSHVLEPSTNTWNSTEFFRRFAPRSIYSTTYKYNLNKVNLNLHVGIKGEIFEIMAKFAREIRPRGILAGPHQSAFVEFVRNGQNPASLDPGISAKYFQMVGAVELFEIYFNVTLSLFEWKETLPVGPSVLNKFHDEFALFPLHLAGFKADYLNCVNKASNQIDVASFLNPLDKWIWLFSFISFVLLGLFLRSRTLSPFFMLLAPVFLQDSSTSVKRFSFLVLIWSFSCFLLSNLFSGMIGSFLLVPPTNPFAEDFEQLYQEGYKLIVPRGSYMQYNLSYYNVFKTALLETGLGDLETSAALRQRHEFFLKLVENMETTENNEIDTLDKRIENGKGCAFSDIREHDFRSIVAQAYPGYVGFRVKEKLMQYMDSWSFIGHYQSPLHRAFSTFASTGLNSLYTETYAHLFSDFRKSTLGPLMRRKDPHHIETWYFSVGRVEIPYLLSLKHEQTKLVFYMWIGLSALSTLVFLLSKLSISKVGQRIQRSVRQSAVSSLQFFCRSLRMGGVADRLHRQKARAIEMLRNLNN